MKSRKDADLLTWAASQNTASSNVTPAEAAPTGNPFKHKNVSIQNHYNRTSSYVNLERKLDTMIDKSLVLQKLYMEVDLARLVSVYEMKLQLVIVSTIYEFVIEGTFYGDYKV